MSAVQQTSLFDDWIAVTAVEEPEPEVDDVETTISLAIRESVASLRDLGPPTVWEGEERLRIHLRPLPELLDLVEPGEYEDLGQFVEALRRFGQVRPVTLSESGAVVARGYLVEAAAELGWTHVAARLEIAERSLESADQTSLVEEIERVAVRNGEVSEADLGAIRSLSVRDPLAGLSETEIAAVNQTSLDPDTEWVGLPEFLPVGEPLKVVVSCDSEDDRDALFSLLGIRTIHKGTRGTLSVWWPDREKEDLSSLRFDYEEEPEP